MKTFLLDSGVAVGLVLALLLVVGLDRALVAPKANEPGTVIITKPGDEPVRERGLRLAVTPTEDDKETGKWDDMGKLLNHLGEGYRYTVFPRQDLRDPRKYAECDVLFLTCGRGEIEEMISQNLREFVARGGTLYASDWRYECVAQAFPDFRAEDLIGKGNFQHLQARVLDPGLADLVGRTIPLEFNLSQWRIAAFRGPRVTVLIEGDYVPVHPRGTPRPPTVKNAPLLVKFPFGKGTVIFTSFHNEKQNSEVEQKLLRYLVFSAVTARVESLVNQTMLKGGFSPQKSNLLSASSGNQQVKHTYVSKKGRRVRFTLGFENAGANLKLTVVSPQGKTFEQEGTSTFSIEEANVPGNWQYTVTAVRVPYQDFPFTLTVGEAE